MFNDDDEHVYVWRLYFVSSQSMTRQSKVQKNKDSKLLLSLSVSLNFSSIDIHMLIIRCVLYIMYVDDTMMFFTRSKGRLIAIILYGKVERLLRRCFIFLDNDDDKDSNKKR